MTPLALLVEVSTAVAETSSRTAKTAALAGLLRTLTVEDPAAIEVSVGLLSGSPRQRKTGIGYRGVGDLPPPAPESSLTVNAVDAAFEELQAVTGSGSAARRRAVLDKLMAAATADEQRFLVRVLLGELRQGALEAVLVSAIASSSGLALMDVRRAVMLRGDLASIATLALVEGGTAIAALGLSVGRAIQPMLASSAKTVGEALLTTGVAAVEEKFDGVRAQIHMRDGEVKVFTRTLDDVTSRMPEVVALARDMPCAAAVLADHGPSSRRLPDSRPRMRAGRR